MLNELKILNRRQRKKEWLEKKTKGNSKRNTVKVG